MVKKKQSMGKGEVLSANQIVDWGKQNDGRVIIDDKHAEFIKDSGLLVCDKCEGTGNEFFFMYKQCEKCKGKGYIGRKE